jgi:hypothetical protein
MRSAIEVVRVKLETFLASNSFESKLNLCLMREYLQKLKQAMWVSLDVGFYCSFDKYNDLVWL